MAKYSNLPFRLLCREYGAGLCTTEMVAVESYLRGGSKELEDRKRTVDADEPLAIQLFGSDAERLAQAAADAASKGAYDAVDLNLGCPAEVIVAQGGGGSILKDPVAVGAIVEPVVNAVDIPVTVKMRLGWRENRVVELAKAVERAGAAAVTIHARTVQQQYRGAADWNAIRAAKQAVRIPVIGNGDARTPADVQRFRDETGCDAVGIGRGSLGNPFVFGRQSTRLDAWARLVELFDEWAPREDLELKMQALVFLAGFEGSPQARGDVSRLKTRAEVAAATTRWLEKAGV